MKNKFLGLNLVAWMVVSALWAGPAGPEAAGADGTATEELRSLMTTALTAARLQNEAKLKEIAHEMMIPNYESWFKTTFGEEQGTRMAAAYGRNLDQKEKSLPGVFEFMVKKEGQLLVEEVRNPQAPGDNWCGKALVDTAKKDTTFYWVTLGQAQSDGTKRYLPIGHFTLVEGAYRRLDCFDLGLSAGPGHSFVGPLRVGGNVQAARIINRVQPMYPLEARAQGISGTVRLHVVLATDGTVKTMEVVSGPTLLQQAALDAVRQWRYQQTFLNGLPVEIDTTIDVIFSLRS